MIRSLLTLLVLATLLAPRPRAGGSGDEPSPCPYCHGDPELMQASGISSHAGFAFGAADTHAADELLPTVKLVWAETAHFRLGFGMGPYKVDQKEKKKIRAELKELALALPDVKPKTKVLDPWLRVHLYAHRVEKTWKRFLEVMQVAGDAFPDPRTSWILGTPYWGEGLYLGMKDKFEALMLPSEYAQVDFLRTQFGLQITETQRWHVPERGTMMVVMNSDTANIREDVALHNHLTFNLAINMLDGFKHYAYETPIWLREGLAHFMERELDPSYNSFDASEGSIAKTSRKSDWISATKKIIGSGKAPRLAELMNIRTYAELTLEHHFATWSMTSFLIEAHPEEYACLNGRLHGLKNEAGMPDGSDMKDRHRDFFRECIGMTYPRFDTAWREWALAQ